MPRSPAIAEHTSLPRKRRATPGFLDIRTGLPDGMPLIWRLGGAGVVLVALCFDASAQASGGTDPAQGGELLPPRLKLDRALSETRQIGKEASQSDAVTFARGQRIEGTINEQIVLEGNAEIRRAGTVLRGDRIMYTQATDQVDIQGNARIYRQGAAFSGPEMSFRIDAQTGRMPDATFTYAPRNGRGEATLIEFLGEQRARMEEARFTTCAPGDNAWWVQAESIDFNMNDESATASWGRVYFQGVPILASPILGFPLGDRRRTGFLTPSFGLSSTLGTDIRVPFYWNIAPNYDYTIAPRVMTKRGLQLGNEFRLLQPEARSTLVYDVLPNDRQTGTRRDYLGVRYDYAAANGFAAGVNYNRVSDDNYFVDFSSTIVGSSQKVLPQDAFVSYNQPYWTSSVRVTQNQVLQDPAAPITPPYERVPEVSLRGFIADWKGFEAAVDLNGTHFTNPGLQDGTRYIVNPRVAYPILAPGWFIIPRAQLSATSYNLDAQYNADTNQTRVLPILSLDTGLIFERDAEWFGKSAVQTLEPRLYYAYIPYRNQSQLPNFDSALADLNYVQFFTENIYSGYDRISNANQLTLAATTRVLDAETGGERLRAALAQRYYFSPQQVTLPNEAPRTGNKSDFLAGVSAFLGNNWAIDFAAQYSAEENAFSRATVGTRWQPRRASVLSAYYRYLNNGSSNSTTNTNQIDLAAQWPLSDRWYGVGRFNYSLQNDRVIDALAGFEYKQDCWLLRFAVQRFATNTNSYTNNFYLQLELNGFTSVGTNALSQLQRNIPGYRVVNPVPNQPGAFDFYE